MSPKEIQGTEHSFDADSFLRSINLRYDAEAPERIAHFQPTAKSASLLRSLLMDNKKRAYFIIAPYGSGKSLTATYALHVTENRSESADCIKQIENRLKEVSPELKDWATRRRRSNKSGLVIALHGYQALLPESIKDAVIEAMKRCKRGRQVRSIESLPCSTMEDALKLLNVLRSKCAGSLDRIVLLWDEFGQHIETLMREGKPSELTNIQLLAEFMSRSNFPMTMGLMLHQGLLHYAGNMPQSVRTEWTKIEGRFETIQYVDASKEVYRLISEVVASRPGNSCSIQVKDSFAAAKRSHGEGLFKEFSKKELAAVLSKAYPLTPSVLYLLPRISARVAQNERTLFSFLYVADLSEPVLPDRLYDYFGSDMRSDTAVGGTYRQWLETESALSKLEEDGAEAIALKAACLLSLGTGGERTRASRSLLSFACAGFRNDHSVKKVIKQLIDRKLLLHRKHSDEVAVWHGTDLDLRGRLEEEKQRLRSSFDVTDFLMKEAAPPVGRPTQYNDKYRIRRYFMGEYQTIGSVQCYFRNESTLEELPLDCDGKMVYMLAETQEELDRAEQFAATKFKHDRLVAVLPNEPLPIRDAALEVRSLLNIQNDSSLMDSDPLALSEVMQMTDDARAHLQRLLDRLVLPGEKGPKFICRGKVNSCDTNGQLEALLSETMSAVYPMTPRINNEMIVRKKPTGVVVNARKKLVLAIMERHGVEELGLEGYTPDVSMFRTVLLHTGLYRYPVGKDPGYAAPADVKDPGLRLVWERLHDFFTSDSEEAKPIRPLFEELVRPPIGLRTGLMPILLAAAIKAFPRAISLTCNGQYVQDIVPSVFEDICKDPDKYRVLVLKATAKKRNYLSGLHQIFSAAPAYQTPDSELIRLCYEALEAWKAQLPRAAMTARNISDSAQKFRDIIKRVNDPVHLFISEIPEAVGFSLRDYKKLVAKVRKIKVELEDVILGYERIAIKSIRQTLGFASSDKSVSVRVLAADWSKCFPDVFIENLHDMAAKGALSRMQMDYETDGHLAESLSMLLIGRSISLWDDATATRFEQRLGDTVRHIEELALETDVDALGRSNAREGLENLLASRMKELYNRLVILAGDKKAAEVLVQLDERQIH